jgi:hypothetical protein
MKNIMWAIVYRDHGLYIGTWFTRKDAIYEHCKAKGKTWEQCKASGDRVVKVKIEIVTDNRARVQAQESKGE